MVFNKDERRARYDAAQLREFTTKVFEHFGLSPADAATGAEVLVDADLSGIESHGIAHVPGHPGYVPGFKSGIVNPRPNIQVLRESPSTAVWDADGGLGVVVATQAMRATIAKAEETGIGMIAVGNGRHFGAAGYYARIAAEHDLIGMAMCNTPPIGVPTGGREKVFGTNPLAMAAPVKDDSPFLLDMATTVVAGGKFEIAKRQGKPIPRGWGLDSDGNESTDPNVMFSGGAILPLGSSPDTSSHKGYGLGLMVDILTGVLSGGMSGLFADMVTAKQSYWFSAWRIDAFRDVDEFKSEMKSVVDKIRSTATQDGVDAVMVAGDPEAMAYADRTANGIPLDEETIEQLTAIGEECGLTFPSPV